MEFFLVWIIGGIIVAMIASSKGYSGFGWFLYGCLILPIALVHALLLGNIDQENRIACPHCAEKIKREAKICPHCRSKLSPPPTAEASGLSRTGGEEIS